MKYDLMYCCLGNGLSVCNRAVEEHGDYKKVAHISYDRTVTFYDKKLPENIKTQIAYCALTDDSNVSTSQQMKVFTTPPKQFNIPSIEKVKTHIQHKIWSGNLTDSLNITEEVYYFMLRHLIAE